MHHSSERFAASPWESISEDADPSLEAARHLESFVDVRAHLLSHQTLVAEPQRDLYFEEDDADGEGAVTRLSLSHSPITGALDINLSAARAQPRPERAAMPQPPGKFASSAAARLPSRPTTRSVPTAMQPTAEMSAEPEPAAPETTAAVERESAPTAAESSPTTELVTAMREGNSPSGSPRYRFQNSGSETPHGAVSESEFADYWLPTPQRNQCCERQRC